MPFNSSEVGALAALLRSRAEVIVQEHALGRGEAPLESWIANQAVLDERLQAARDLLLEGPPHALGPQRVAVLESVLELRDTLLAGEMDLEVFGRDAGAEQLRAGLARQLEDMALLLDLLADSLVTGREPPALLEPAQLVAASRAAAAPLLAAAAADGAADPRHAERVPFVHALLARADHLASDLHGVQALLTGAASPLPTLSADELRLFVSPHGWPLAALRRQLNLRSPVLRHALRCAAAVLSAYLLGLWLPWASHPYWLLLAVATVLRGNLEQTLARRDQRIAGTMLGCAVVFVIALASTPWLITLVLLASVGVTHAFALRRYLLTAAAGTVMALLQAHLVHPAGGFALGERIADTLIGAALAWAFCFVLPNWEHRAVRQLVARVRDALRRVAAEALRWPQPAPQDDVALRLARREAYDAIGAIAAAARRTGAEPSHVRLPLHALASLLLGCHGLLAQLATMRGLLRRNGERLPSPLVQAQLSAAVARLDALLADAGGEASAPAAAAPADPLPRMPLPGEDLMRWFERRLGLVEAAAARVAATAAAMVALVRK